MMAPSKAQRSSTAASHLRNSSRPLNALACGLQAYNAYLKRGKWRQGGAGMISYECTVWPFS